MQSLDPNHRKAEHLTLQCLFGHERGFGRVGETTLGARGTANAGGGVVVAGRPPGVGLGVGVRLFLSLGERSFPGVKVVFGELVFSTKLSDVQPALLLLADPITPERFFLGVTPRSPSTHGGGP